VRPPVLTGWIGNKSTADAFWGIGGLIRVSPKWVEAGIKLERFEPQRPEQNGSHEYMHKTLKAHTSSARLEPRRAAAAL